MFNELMDVLITSKNGKSILVKWECLINDENVPMFLSMVEKYERQIERIKSKKGMLVVPLDIATQGEIGENKKIDLTQVDCFKQVKRESCVA